MKREEQIISEAKKHYSDSINCHNAFLHGVEWADEHPKNIWHDSREEPQGEDWLILFEGEKGNYWVQSKDGVIFFHNTWKEYVKAEMVVKWAYIRDLLPKGGEL